MRGSWGTTPLRSSTGENKQTRRNAGLQSGFDLPERAYSSDAKEQTASLWVTSTFRAAVNEFRARASRIQMTDRAVTTTPAILVLEAFNAGGNQEALFRESNTERTRLTNVFTYGTGTHSIRVGGQVEVCTPRAGRSARTSTAPLSSAAI